MSDTLWVMSSRSDFRAVLSGAASGSGGMRDMRLCEMQSGSAESPTLTVRAPLASLRNCLAAQPGGPLMAVLQEPGTVSLVDSRQPHAEVSCP